MINWIGIKEDLPNVDVDVLVHLVDHSLGSEGRSEYDIAMLCDEGDGAPWWLGHARYYDFDRITHWAQINAPVWRAKAK